MAYLYKHTPLETTVPVNLTCLVPTAKPRSASRRASPLKAMLRHFLDFRFETVRRRFAFDLEELRRRIHLLEGFLIIFDALDEAIRIIRKSDGKADAAGKLMKRFALDEEQVEAILETKLYKLARLEIDAIRDELKEKLGGGRDHRGDPEVAEEALERGRRASSARCARRSRARSAGRRSGERRRARVRRRGVHPARGHVRRRHASTAGSSASAS